MSIDKFKQVSSKPPKSKKSKRPPTGDEAAIVRNNQEQRKLAKLADSINSGIQEKDSAALAMSQSPIATTIQHQVDPKINESE